MSAQIILASHGSMAEGVVSAVNMVIGEQPCVSAFGLDAWETPEAIKEQVEQVIAAHPDEYIVILCDIKGGSVHNRLMDLCARDNVSVVSGMNLVLALSLALDADDLDVDTIKEHMAEAKENLAYFDRHSFENASGEEDELW